MPGTSVIMLANNGEKYLDQAIRSVVHQSKTNFELIVANDGSADGTIERVGACIQNDSRIPYSDRNPSFGRPTNPQNIAPPKAWSNNLAFLDPHGYLPVARLTRLVERMGPAPQPQRGTTLSNTHLVDGAGIGTKEPTLRTRDSTPTISCLPETVCSMPRYSVDAGNRITRRNAGKCRLRGGNSCALSRSCREFQFKHATRV